MKSKLKFLISSFICALVFFGAVSCSGNNEPTPIEHTCSRVCSVCGKCLDAECDDEACAVKCPGHQPVTDEHTCSRVCSVCGKCLDLDCTNPVCLDKCEGHQPSTDEHTCSRVCSVCGKCLDQYCTNPVCLDKCEGHQPEEPVIDEDATITSVEVDENAKYYEGMPLSSTVKYRFNLSNGQKSKWYSFVEEELAPYTVNNGYVTLSTTVYEVGKSFVINEQIPVSTASVSSIELLSEPSTKQYTSRTKYADLLLSGSSIKVTYSDNTEIVANITHKMISNTGSLSVGNNEVVVKLQEKTLSFNVNLKINSVSDIKNITGTSDLDCIVVGATTIRNSTLGTGLIVKDIESSDLIGIFYTGLSGTNSAVGLSSVLPGDRIICTVSTAQYGTDDSYGANAGCKYLISTDKTAATFQNSLEIIGHDYSIAPENAIEISTQQELINLIKSKNQQYTYVKLSGIKAYNSGASYGVRFWLDDSINSYAGQVIHFASSDNCSPIFDFNNMNSHIGTDWVNKVFTKTTPCSWTDPMTTTNDVYAVYVGGTNWYEVFTVFDESWILPHSCITGGHIITNATSYGYEDGKYYQEGTCSICSQTNVKEEIVIKNTITDTLSKPVGSYFSNCEAIVVGFAGEYQVEVSTKAGYLILFDGINVFGLNLGNAVNLAPELSVNGYDVFYKGTPIKVGDKFLITKGTYKQADHYVGDFSTGHMVYGGHLDDFEFDPNVKKVYELGNLGGSMISGGTVTWVQKVVATKDNPIYMSGFMKNGKNMICFYESSNGKINAETLAGNVASNMTYTVGSYSRYLTVCKELAVKNMGEQFFIDNFDCFVTSTSEANLDCTDEVLGTYAFEGEFYVYYAFYGNTYVQQIMLAPGNTLKLIKD